jgi:hypothetical protein
MSGLQFSPENMHIELRVDKKKSQIKSKILKHAIKLFIQVTFYADISSQSRVLFQNR